MASLNSKYFIFSNVRTFLARSDHFFSRAIACAEARVHDCNKHACTNDSWSLIEIAQWSKAPLVARRSKSLRHKLLLDHAWVLRLHLSLQQRVAQVVVLSLPLMQLSMQTQFAKKHVNTTDFFKTRIENSHEKSALAIWNTKILFLKLVFNARLKKYFSPQIEFFYDSNHSVRLTLFLVSRIENISNRNHLVQDVRKVACTNLPIIKEHKGALVPDLGNTRGNRCPDKVNKSKNWGGNRTKKDVSEHKEKCIHPDADAARISVITKAFKVKT